MRGGGVDRADGAVDSAASDVSTPGILSRPYRPMTIGIVSFVFLLAFEAMAVGTAMPIAARALDGLSWYAWSFSGFMAASMLATVVAGELVDRIGLLRPLVSGVTFFTAGLIVAGLAPNMLVFVGGRMLQGLGAGSAIVLLLVILARVFPPELRPKALGALSAAWVLPSIVGPSIAGVVAEQLSWRLVFLGLLPLVALPVALVVPRAAALSRARTEETSRQPSRVGLALAAAAGVALLQYAGQELKWWSIALAAVGLGLLVVGLPRLLPRGTLRLARGLPSVVAVRGLLAGAFIGAAAYVPLMLVQHHGRSASVAGLALTVGSLGWSTGAWVQARKRLRMSRPNLVRLGACFVGTSVFVVGIAALPGVPWWLAPLAWILGGLGMGLGMSSLAVLLLEYSPRDEQGTNSAAMQLAEAVGTVTFVALGGVVFASLYGVVESTWAFVPIFGLMAAVATLATLGAGRLRSESAS